MARAKKTGETENKTVENKKKPASKSTRKPIKKPKQTKEQKERVKNTYDKLNLHTHDGRKLTAKEAKFIANYIETGNGLQSVVLAGYRVINPQTQAYQLLAKPYIASEIQYLLDKYKEEKIASAEEILQFYTRVMRGEEKDQFGLDAPLGERIKAGNELAKRLVDIPNKLEGKAQATVTISLDWTGMEEETNNETNNTEETNQ